MPRVLLIGSIVFVVILALVLGVVFYTRNRTATPTATTTTTTTTTSKNPIITLNYWRPIDGKEVFQDIIDQYERDHPTVKINYVTKDPTQYLRDSLTASSSGQGPDIWSIPNSWIPELKDSLSSPAPTVFADKSRQDNNQSRIFDVLYPPLVKQELYADVGNKIIGFPLAIDTLALYLNRNLLNQRANELRQQKVSFDASLFSQGPRTWDDLIQLVEFYTVKSGSNVSKSAIALGTANVYRAQDILAALMLQSGAKITSADKLTANFNLPQLKRDQTQFNPGLQALNFYTAFADPSKLSYTWNDTIDSDSVDAFLTGKTAMLIGYSSLGRDFAQKNPNFQFATVALPQIKNAAVAVDFASYYVETVPKASANQAAAWDFVHYLAVTAQSAYTSNSHRPSPRKMTALPTSLYGRLTYGPPFLFQPQTAVSWPRGGQPEKFEALFSQLINNVNRGLSASAALDSAAADATALLRQGAFNATSPADTPVLPSN